MNIEVCVYNLGTGATVYGEISDRDDWAALEHKVNPLGWNDVETQVMDSDLSSHIGDDNLHEFMDLVDEFPKVDPNLISDLLVHTGYSTAYDVLSNELPVMYCYGHNKVAAFMQYYEWMDYRMPPKEWEDFIDWGEVLDYHLNGGLYVCHMNTYDKYHNARYMFVQTY